MKKLRYLPLLVLLLTAGCAKTHPTLSPAGEVAFQATRVVKALDLVQTFAIDANAQAPPLLSTDSTRKVVAYVRAAVQTIGMTPGGWKPTVSAGLAQLQKDILPADWQRLVPYIALVRSLLEVIP